MRREDEVVNGGLRFSVDQDCHGAVVEEADFHVCAETAGFDRDVSGAEMRGYGFVEGDGLLRAGGFDERGSVSFACVAEEGELGNEEDRAFHVLDTEIKFSVRIIEDAELRDFFGDVYGVVFGVLCAYAEEDEETVGDLTNGFAVYRDGGFSNSLDDCAHRDTPVDDLWWTKGRYGQSVMCTMDVWR